MVKLIAVVLLAGAVAVPKSCSINFGSGSTNPSAPSSAVLNVPFFMQQQELSCGPAAIEMWAAYDGVSTTQQEIGSYIGCGANGSTSPGQIVAGVQHFTTSGKDAALEYNGGVGDPATIAGTYYSAEITSITELVPSIPLVNGATHAVVLTGGDWHIDPDSGLYVWDLVAFNDPAIGPRILDAGSWTGYDDTQHVISESASAQAYENYMQNRSKVAISGSGLSGKPLPY
jgi:hypothetical protein